MNPFAIIRTLLVYLICLPLAIYCGYMLATPESRQSIAVFGLILMLLVTPLFLKWHHPLLLFSWSLGATVFFLPGQPQLWLLMAVISLLCAVVQRSLNRGMNFLPAWSVGLPLVVLAIVIVATAMLTGGFGIRAGGGSTYGGRRYFLLLGAILSFFALTSRQIPANCRGRYAALFFLPGIMALISSLFVFAKPSWYFIFLIFPPDAASIQAVFDDSVALNPDNISRLGGAAAAASCIFYFMICVYGIRRLFELRNFWKLIVLITMVVVSFCGGFRSIIITMAMTFAAVFFFERLHRTRLLPLCVLTLCLAAAVILPIVEKLPLSAQRALSFLPVKVNPVVAMDAQNSSEWRIRMWNIVLPEVPRYLWLGKGCGINGNDLELANALAASGRGDTAAVAMLAGDYHNGPLSVLIPFGVWGALAFGWFLLAAGRALYRNYRYSDPALKTTNTFLFASFLARVFIFFVIVGGMHYALVDLVGLVGFGISLNGGICGPKTPQKETETTIMKTVPLRRRILSPVAGTISPPH